MQVHLRLARYLQNIFQITAYRQSRRNPIAAGNAITYSALLFIQRRGVETKIGKRRKVYSDTRWSVAFQSRRVMDHKLPECYDTTVLMLSVIGLWPYQRSGFQLFQNVVTTVVIIFFFAMQVRAKPELYRGFFDI